ncbi:MAG: MoaD family protein [Armatimonadetes bacterium]|nr:MoaD family protein [Armatimonadota bacterium]NIM23992.1 MoaD family protein [Armatimonadota bacterium]NIM67842.1 MoaD family protein [Armatimonadota bacterium]NIM76373.1 MoaD family protein [Armatimonadota bacterium]NIN06072.1 MoaD family protein [Armatimonadota bacterium]
MVTLKLFAGLRDAVGKKEVQLDKDDLTLTQLLEHFAQSYGEKVRDFLVDKEGNIDPSVLLLVNDEPVGQDLQAQVKSGDVVSILLPTAGG